MPKIEFDTASTIRWHAKNDPCFYLLKQSAQRLVPGLTRSIRRALLRRDLSALRAALLQYANFGT